MSNTNFYNANIEPGIPIDLVIGDKIKAVRDISEGAKNPDRIPGTTPYVNIPEGTVLTLVGTPRKVMGVLEYKFSGTVDGKEYNDLRIMGMWGPFKGRITTGYYRKIPRGGFKRGRSITRKRSVRRNRRSNKRSYKRSYKRSNKNSK